jgi:hypothetical protein
MALAMSNIIAIVTLNYFDKELQIMQGGEVIYGLDKLSQLALLLLAGLVSGLIIGLWALYKWLFLLTAFARVLLEKGPNYSQSDLDSALNDIKEQKGYLSQVWLFASAFLVIPVVPLAVTIALDLSVASPTIFSLFIFRIGLSQPAPSLAP